MKARHYDLVLIDYKMPVKNGAEVTAEFRIWESKQNRQRVQVVYCLTAYHDDQKQGMQTQCLDAGMQGVLPKPMQVGTILTILASEVEA